MAAPKVRLKEEEELLKKNIGEYEKKLKEEKSTKERLKEWWNRREIDYAQVAGAGKNQPGLDSLPKAFQAWLDLLFHLLPMIGDAAERTAKIGMGAAKGVAQPGFEVIKREVKETAKTISAAESSNISKTAAIMTVIYTTTMNLSAAAVEITAQKLAEISPVFKDRIASRGEEISQQVRGDLSPR